MSYAIMYVNYWCSTNSLKSNITSPRHVKPLGKISYANINPREKHTNTEDFVDRAHIPVEMDVCSSEYHFLKRMADFG